MAYRNSRLDEVAFQQQFEEAVNIAMQHVGVNYSEALELVFTPLVDQGGMSVVEFVRRGQLPQARRALSDLIDQRKRIGGSQKLVTNVRKVS